MEDMQFEILNINTERRINGNFVVTFKKISEERQYTIIVGNKELKNKKC